MNWKIESDEQKVGQLKLPLGKGCSSLNDMFWNKTRGVIVSNRIEDTTIKEDDMKDPRDRVLEVSSMEILESPKIGEERFWRGSQLLLFKGLEEGLEISR